MSTLESVTMCAGMVSGDMQKERGRRNWEEEAQRRYELEQLAEADREQRIEVGSPCPSLLNLCSLKACCELVSMLSLYC